MGNSISNRGSVKNRLKTTDSNAMLIVSPRNQKHAATSLHLSKKLNQSSNREVIAPSAIVHAFKGNPLGQVPTALSRKVSVDLH